MRFYPGYTLENIGKLTIKQFVIMFKEISTIVSAESGESEEEVPLSGAAATQMAMAMFPRKGE